MSAILNQPWEDVADDVTGAIEKAVQPLLKKAADDIYGGLLDATQDCLKDNLAFNIASRINAAEREARDARDALMAISQFHLPDQPSAIDIPEADYARRHIVALRHIAYCAAKGMTWRDKVPNFNDSDNQREADRG